MFSPNNYLAINVIVIISLFNMFVTVYYFIFVIHV